MDGCKIIRYFEHGVVQAGYTSIVGGGDNAVILHYISNNAPLKDGDVVCGDAGCEYAWYTTDVTRAWPVNGIFTSAQRKLYRCTSAMAQLRRFKRVLPLKMCIWHPYIL